MTAKKNFPLRIDPKLYEALERWAADEFRSVNGHIEYLLRETVIRAGRLNASPMQTGATPPQANRERTDGHEQE